MLRHVEGEPPHGDEKGDDQGHRAAGPGHGIGQACAGEAKGPHQPHGAHTAHHQFHDAGKGGHEALTQPLQRVAEDEQQRQHPHGQSDNEQIDIGKIGYPGVVPHEQPGQRFAEQQKDRAHKGGPAKGHGAALHNAGADAVQLARAVVLGHKGTHGKAEAAQRQGAQRFQLVGGGESGHRGAAQTVQGILQHQRADGNDAALEAHGQPHVQMAQHLTAVEPPVRTMQPQRGEGPVNVDHAGDSGQQLGNHGGHARAHHPQRGIQDEQYVQHDVEQAACHQKIQRGRAVAQSAQHVGHHVEQHGGRNAREHHHQITGGILQNFRRGLQQNQQLAGARHAGRREHHTDHAAQNQAGRVALRARRPRRRRRSAGR